MLHSRMARVSQLIKQELADLIDQQLKNPKIPGFVTVHSVKVSKDLSYADVYVTFLGDEKPETIEGAMEGFAEAAGYLRNELGRRIVLKYLPELRFHYNPSTSYAQKLERLLKENGPKPTSRLTDEE